MGNVMFQAQPAILPDLGGGYRLTVECRCLLDGQDYQTPIMFDYGAWPLTEKAALMMVEKLAEDHVASALASHKRIEERLLGVKE